MNQVVAVGVDMVGWTGGPSPCLFPPSVIHRNIILQISFPPSKLDKYAATGMGAKKKKSCQNLRSSPESTGNLRITTAKEKEEEVAMYFFSLRKIEICIECIICFPPDVHAKACMYNSQGWHQVNATGKGRK